MQYNAMHESKSARDSNSPNLNMTDFSNFNKYTTIGNTPSYGTDPIISEQKTVFYNWTCSITGGLTLYLQDFQFLAVFSYLGGQDSKVDSRPRVLCLGT